MTAFLKNHLWVVILLLGGSIVVVQKNRNEALRKTLTPEVRIEPTRSNRSFTRRSGQAPANNEFLLQRYQELRESDPVDCYDTFIRELSDLTSKDLTRLINEPQLRDQDSFEMLRNYLITLRRALDPLEALRSEEYPQGPPKAVIPGVKTNNSFPAKQMHLFQMVANDSPEAAEKWLAENDLGEHEEQFEAELRRLRFLADPVSNQADWQSLFPEKSPLFPSEKLDGLAAAIATTGDQELRSRMIKSLMVSSVIEDPAGARLRAEDLSLTPGELKPVFESLASDGVGSPELLDWALSLPLGISSQFNEHLFSNFAVRDLTGAARWLEQLTPSYTRDVFLSRYANLMTGVDPSEAMQWARQIASPLLRGSSEDIIQPFLDSTKENE